MSQISKLPLKKEVEERVFEVLMESIAAAKKKQTIEDLTADLFSPTERLMLAKRLSIALLLIKKYDQRTISKWLKVSLGTISKVSYVMQKGKGGYQSVINTILAREEFKNLIFRIDDAIAKILPPPSLNWKAYRKLRWKEKINDQKAF